MYEHNALGYWSGLALCLTKVRSSRARCPATALIEACLKGFTILLRQYILNESLLHTFHDNSRFYHNAHFSSIMEHSFIKLYQTSSVRLRKEFDL